MQRDAIYRKNIYRWEQWARIVVGLVAAVAGAVVTGGWARPAIVVTALGVAATGVVGYCPACALVGRKLTDEAAG
jgi:CHASE2 domain-containing sensor protein